MPRKKGSRKKSGEPRQGEWKSHKTKESAFDVVIVGDGRTAGTHALVNPQQHPKRSHFQHATGNKTTTFLALRL